MRHGYNVNKVINLNCKIPVSCEKGLGSRTGQILFYSINILNLRKSFSLLPYMW